MGQKKLNYSYLFSIFSVLLLIYIFVSIYIDYINLDSIYTYTKNSYLVKVTILSGTFIVFAIVFTIFKLYRRKSIQRNIDELSSEINNPGENKNISSDLDPLTQCLNKRYFMQRFEEEFSKAIRDKYYLSLLLINIDEFSAFNDIYGEDEGNECMKFIANLLINYSDESIDLVGRLDGDEFAVLLVDNKEPKKVGKPCVKSVSSLNIPHDNSIASNVLTITISATTILPTHPDQINEFIQKTKEKLKEAKKSGRNRFLDTKM